MADAMTPFREYLQAHQADLFALLHNDLATVLPGGLSQAQFTQDLEEWFALIERPERLTELLQTAAIRPDTQVAITVSKISSYRQRLFDLAIDALEAGVPHMATILRKFAQIYNTLDRVGIQQIIQMFQDQTERFARVIDSAPLSIIEFDTNGIVKLWNPGAERIFGWSAAEAIGQNVVELLVPDVELEHVQHVIDLLLSGDIVNSRNLNRTKDGRLITCQWSNAVLRNSVGVVVGVLSQTEDVSAAVVQEQSLQAAEQRLRSSETLLRVVLDNTPGLVHAKDLDGNYLLVNRQFADLFQISPAALVGMRDEALIGPDMAAQMRAHDRQVIDSNQIQVREIETDSEYGSRIFEEIKFPIYDTSGQLIGTGGISTDITERRRADLDRARLQQEVINAQQAMLRELSTPLIPMADGLVIMPLIGAIDSNRAQQVIETLLHGVNRNHADTVILDITGVPIVDTQVAAALIQAAQAVKLLGAQVILTGIRPEIAQTLVGLGVDLSRIQTQGSLQAGINAVLRRKVAR
jgi:rsbT co-antagonist protein RsbR